MIDCSISETILNFFDINIRKTASKPNKAKKGFIKWKKTYSVLINAICKKWKQIYKYKTKTFEELVTEKFLNHNGSEMIIAIAVY